LKQLGDWVEFESAIKSFCYTITNDPERSENEVIEELAASIRPLSGLNKAESMDYVTLMLEDEVRRYNRVVPPDPDSGLAYYTGSWNPIAMLTSSFAHGDWGHITFNLIFFFAFAASVEALVGPLKYVLFAYDDHGVVNVMAHVTGGIGGYLFGVAFLGKVRKDAIHIQTDLDHAKFEGRFR